MRVSGEKFGDYSASWDVNEKVSIIDAKKAGITVTPLPSRSLAELKKRWAVIEPKWIEDAMKLGIDGAAAVQYYRDELARIEGDR